MTSAVGLKWALAMVIPLLLVWAANYLKLMDHYLFNLAKVLYLANTEVILPNRPVHWLQEQRKAAAAAAALPGAPNILVILTDDLGFNDLSGGAGVATPNIDSIAAHGATFTQAYAAQATCAPSRAALLTGRLPTQMGFEFTPTPKFFGKLVGDLTRLQKAEHPPLFHSHLYDSVPNMNDISLPSNYSMLPEYLRPLGYSSYFIGKWDSGFKEESSPLGRGYDEALYFPFGSLPYAPPGDPNIVSAKGVGLDFVLLRVLNNQIIHNRGPRFRPNKYLTDYLSDQAAHLIRSLGGRRTAEDSRHPDPWHLFLAYNAPHNPFQAWKEDFHHPDLAHIHDHNARVYAAMLRALDRGVGQVLQALRDSGQWDNTLVLFTSDNGGASYVPIENINAPFRGYKATFFEGGLRVPTFLQWPARLPRGSVLTEPVIATDFVPTFVAAAGGGDRSDLHGKNLLPRLVSTAGLSSSTPRTFFWRCGAYRAVRRGDLKLMVNALPDKVWFYDLAQDPTEKVNLAPQVNVTSGESLRVLATQFASLCTEAVPRDDGLPNEATRRCQLVQTYQAMMDEDAQQQPPLWASLSAAAICVDHRAGIPCRKQEEHVYFSN